MFHKILNRLAVKSLTSISFFLEFIHKISNIFLVFYETFFNVFQNKIIFRIVESKNNCRWQKNNAHCMEIIKIIFLAFIFTKLDILCHNHKNYEIISQFSYLTQYNQSSSLSPSNISSRFTLAILYI